MEGLLWLLGAVVVVSIIAFLHIRKGRQRASSTSATISSADEPADSMEAVTTSAANHEILIGSSPTAPAITIIPSPSQDDYKNAKAVPIGEDTSISRLNCLVSTLGPAATALEVSGKKVMEVVINGDLVRSANGDGFRAFSRVGGEISEHAKLFELDKLNTLINATAVWQIASVIVAQKHLADISRKLDEIKQSIGRVSRFLDSERRGRIQGAYKYILGAHASLAGGQFPLDQRNELEGCERTLLEIEEHLFSEFTDRLQEEVKDHDTFGTDSIKKGITDKIADLESIANDLAFCISVRIAGLHVVSLFPGQQHICQVRRGMIYASLDRFDRTITNARDHVTKEINDRIKAVTVTEQKLKNRRYSLMYDLEDMRNRVLAKGVDHGQQIEQIDKLLLEDAKPKRLFLEFDGDALVGARELLAAT